MPDAALLSRVEAWRAAWERVLAKAYLKPLVATGLAQGCVVLPYALLHRADLTLAEALLAQPKGVLDAAAQALGAEAVLRVVELGEAQRVPVRHLRPRQLERLVSIEGLVKRSSTIRPGVTTAAWRCRFCNALVEYPNSGLELEPPLECHPDDGGCGKKSQTFDLDEEKSRKVPTQHLEVQESPEALVGGEQPGRIPVHLSLDLCGLVQAGDRVVINGILRDTRKRKAAGRVEAVSEYVLSAVSVERRSQAYEDVVLTSEDEATIRTLAMDPGVYERLAASIAPALYGLEHEKLAVVLQLFGGVEKQLPDGLRVRGDIHVLLVGDPGIAKTQLLRSAARLSPRGIFTSGKGSSAAGLTATVQRDPETDRWTFEAGAMVLADRGLCAVDELDKMREEDTEAILGALEQGVVTINKAGLSLELNARCSVLAAGNPEDGRFDPSFESISAQIDLAPPLLSRFDLIFAMPDTADEARDRATIRHILNPGAAEPPIPQALLRKFVAHARRTCNPVESPEAVARIEAYYVQNRRDTIKAGSPSTPRQGEAVKRLAQAAARVRLSDTVTLGDVERAIGLVEECRARLGGDMDKALTGTSKKKRDAIHAILSIVHELSQNDEHGAPLVEVLQRAWAEDGIPERKASEILGELHRDGRVFNPPGKSEHYRRA